jgi:hypothetical protein
LPAQDEQEKPTGVGTLPESLEPGEYHEALGPRELSLSIEELVEARAALFSDESCEIETADSWFLTLVNHHIVTKP